MATEQARRRTTAIAVVVVLAVALVALTVYVAVGRGPDSHQARPPVAHAQPPAVPQLIMQRHADRDGRLDLEGTLEMFSYAFEPLPGVSLPSGPRDGSRNWADVAMRSILAHESELSDAQSAIVASYLVPAQPPATRSGPPSGPRFVSYLAAVDPVKVQSNIEAYVAAAVKEEAARLGHSLADTPVFASPGTIHVILSGKGLSTDSGHDAEAWTVATHGPLSARSGGHQLDDGSKRVTDCTIFFRPETWQQVDSSGNWAPDQFDVAAVDHEVFHCFQGFVLGNVNAATFNDAPDWVIEGGAEWAMDSITGFDDDQWSPYMAGSRTALAKRAYDGFGVFFEVEYLGRPLWPAWWQIWSDAALGGWQTSDWFNAVAGDHLDALRQAWGASYYVDPSLGHDWTEAAANQTIVPYDVPVQFDNQLDLQADAYSTLQVDIPPQADRTVVVASAVDASGRWIDSAHREGRDTGKVSMCWGGSSSCTCPGGGASSAGDLTPVTGGVSWAMTALQLGADAHLIRLTVDDFCRQPKQPPPPPSCQGGCPGSNGDPHLHTVNGRQYVFQAAGEYTLLRAADGSVEIQARQEPQAGSATSQVTINTALAVRIGSRRVGVYVGSNGLEIHIDGKPVTPSDPVQLDGGGTVTSHPNGVQIDIPGGTTLWALPIARFGINVQLAPSADLASNGLGLLGAIVPGYEFPKLPDGTEFPFQSARTPAARYAYLYGPFAAAWRVTDQTTLFDYANGATTASYNVSGFQPEGGPQVPLTLDPAQRAAAEQSCNGIDDVELRNDCVYDVTLTQDTGFVVGYQGTATFQATGVTALDGGAPSVGGSPSPSQPPSATPSAAPSASSSVVGQLVISRLLDEVSLVRGTALSPAGILYVMAEQSDRTQILRMDTNQVEPSADVNIIPPISVLDGLAFARDSVWAVERSGTGSCSATQEMVGPASPIVAAVTLSGCPDGSPVIAATTDAIWVQDGPSSGTSRLDRIDPATGKVTGSVPLPAGGGGALTASTTTVFWSSSAGVFRIDPTSSTAVLLGPAVTSSVPSGDSIWVQRDPGTAVLLGATGSTGATRTIEGSIAGANATDLFVARPNPQGGEELWRYPVDGSAAVLLAPAASDTGVIPAWAVSATAHAPLLVGSQYLIQAIAQSPGSPQPLALQLEMVQIK